MSPLPSHLSSAHPRLCPFGVCVGTVLFLFFVGGARAVPADSSLNFEVRLSQQEGDSVAEVVADDGLILALTAAAPEEARQKADLIAQRLNSLAAAGKTDNSFALLPRATGAAIVCDSEVVVAAASAPDNSYSPTTVMAAWLENIKAAFARPYISMPTTLLAVRVGREITLPAYGPGVPFLRLEVEPPYIAEARVDPRTGRVLIAGKSVGQAQLRLSARGESIESTIGVIAAPPTDAPAKERSDGSSQFPTAAKEPPLVTWFSNHPENVSGPMPLFHAQFPGKASGRLFYHHKSVASGLLKFTVWVQNRDPELVQRVFVVRGTGGPHSLAPIAGRDAIASFYSNLTAERGELLLLQPGEANCLDFTPWNPYTTVGGLLQFTCLEEATLDVYIEAIDASHQAPVLSSGSLASPVFKEWAFPGHEQVPMIYTVGEEPVHFLLGLPGEKALASEEILRGSYGVEQQLKISISNPFSAPRTVEVRCLAGGGGAAYVVALLDGRLLVVDLPGSGETALLATIALPANGSANVNLITAGVGGCWYPVVFTLQTAR